MTEKVSAEMLCCSSIVKNKEEILQESSEFFNSSILETKERKKNDYGSVRCKIKSQILEKLMK